MAKAKMERPGVISLRLRKGQDQLFRALAYERRLTQTDLLREAADLLLESQTQDRVNEVEGLYVLELRNFLEEIKSLKAGINSLRAMVARGNRLTGANHFFLKDCDKERMQKAVAYSNQLFAGRRKLEEAGVTELTPAPTAQAG